MGVEVRVEGHSKSFGSQNIWDEVTLTLPPGEISVMLGPSETGKSVFLKSLVGLLKPEAGSLVVTDTDTDRCGERRLYEIRRLFDPETSEVRLDPATGAARQRRGA